MSWCIRMAFFSDKKTWLKKSDFLNLKIWLNLSDFFYKKIRIFCFFSIIIKEWLKYTTKLLFKLFLMVKNYKNRPQRDGIHFSCWSKKIKKNKKSGGNFRWNFSFRITWFTIILFMVFLLNRDLFWEIILRWTS